MLGELGVGGAAKGMELRQSVHVVNVAKRAAAPFPPVNRTTL